MEFIVLLINFINDLGAATVMVGADVLFEIGNLVRHLLEVLLLGGQVSP